MDDVYDTGVAARAGFVTDARADTRAAEEANLNLNLPSGPLAPATTNLNVTNLNLNIPSGSLTPVDPTLADLFAAGDDDQSDYQSIKNIVMLGPNGECIEGGGGGGGGGGDGGSAGVHGTADPAAAGPATAPPPRPPKSKMAPLPPPEPCRTATSSLAWASAIRRPLNSRKDGFWPESSLAGKANCNSTSWVPGRLVA